MKKNFLSIILFLFTSVAIGQVLDSAALSVSYNFYYRPDSTNTSLKRDDILILEVGKNASKCYSFYRYLRDSMLAGKYSEQQLQGATKFSINLDGFSKNGISAKIFRNNITKTITV